MFERKRLTLFSFLLITSFCPSLAGNEDELYSIEIYNQTRLSDLIKEIGLEEKKNLFQDFNDPTQAYEPKFSKPAVYELFSQKIKELDSFLHKCNSLIEEAERKVSLSRDTTSQKAGQILKELIIATSELAIFTTLAGKTGIGIIADVLVVINTAKKIKSIIKGETHISQEKIHELESMKEEVEACRNKSLGSLHEETVKGQFDEIDLVRLEIHYILRQRFLRPEILRRLGELFIDIRRQEPKEDPITRRLRQLQDGLRLPIVKKDFAGYPWGNLSYGSPMQMLTNEQNAAREILRNYPDPILEDIQGAITNITMPHGRRWHYHFYGIPGVGKTTAVEALATYLGLPFTKVSGSDITHASITGTSLSSKQEPQLGAILSALLKEAGKKDEAVDTLNIPVEWITSSFTQPLNIEVPKEGAKTYKNSMLCIEDDDGTLFKSPEKRKILNRILKGEEALYSNYFGITLPPEFFKDLIIILVSRQAMPPELHNSLGGRIRPIEFSPWPNEKKEKILRDFWSTLSSLQNRPYYGPQVDFRPSTASSSLEIGKNHLQGRFNQEIYGHLPSPNSPDPINNQISQLVNRNEPPVSDSNTNDAPTSNRRNTGTNVNLIEELQKRNLKSKTFSSMPIVNKFIATRIQALMQLWKITLDLDKSLKDPLSGMQEFYAKKLLGSYYWWFSQGKISRLWSTQTWNGTVLEDDSSHMVGALLNRIRRFGNTHEKSAYVLNIQIQLAQAITTVLLRIPATSSLYKIICTDRDMERAISQIAQYVDALDAWIRPNGITEQGIPTMHQYSYWFANSETTLKSQQLVEYYGINRRWQERSKSVFAATYRFFKPLTMSLSDHLHACFGQRGRIWNTKGFIQALCNLGNPINWLHSHFTGSKKIKFEEEKEALLSEFYTLLRTFTCDLIAQLNNRRNDFHDNVKKANLLDFIEYLFDMANYKIVDLNFSSIRLQKNASELHKRYQNWFNNNEEGLSIRERLERHQEWFNNNDREGALIQAAQQNERPAERTQQKSQKIRETGTVEEKKPLVPTIELEVVSSTVHPKNNLPQADPSDIQIHSKRTETSAQRPIGKSVILPQACSINGDTENQDGFEGVMTRDKSPQKKVELSKKEKSICRNNETYSIDSKDGESKNFKSSAAVSHTNHSNLNLDTMSLQKVRFDGSNPPLGLYEQYSICHTAGDGDCFFHAAFTESGDTYEIIQKKAANMRSQLSDILLQGQYLENCKELAYFFYAEKYVSKQFNAIPTHFKWNFGAHGKGDTPESVATIISNIDNTTVQQYINMLRTNEENEDTYIPILKSDKDCPATILAHLGAKRINIFELHGTSNSLKKIKTVGSSGSIINILLRGGHFERLYNPQEGEEYQKQAEQIIRNSEIIASKTTSETTPHKFD